MKNLKNYIKNNQLFQLVLLCTVLFSIDALAMLRMREEQHAEQGVLEGLQRNQYFLHAIDDPNNITHQVLEGHPDTVYAVAFSSDGKYIVSGSYGRQNNLILWTLLTDQEDALLKQLKNYNADQIRLIYQLCGKALRGETIQLSSEELQILPQDMQKLLTDLFL